MNSGIGSNRALSESRPRRTGELLIVFVKAPVLGAVKTRLQPHLTPQQSLELYRAMTEDVIERLCQDATFDLAIFHTPPGAEAAIRAWLRGDFVYRPQHGDDLGARMSNAFAWAFGAGYRKSLLVGSDIPTLDREGIDAAFAALDSHDLVLGPSEDGGYYLIGMKRHLPILFREMAWSTQTVGSETLARAREAGITFQQLGCKSDVDTFPQVVALWQRLRTCPGPSRLPRTFAWLSDFFSSVSQEKR